MRSASGSRWLVCVLVLGWVAGCGDEDLAFEPSAPDELGVEPQALTGGPTAALTGGPTSGAAPLSVYFDGTGSKPAADGSWISQCRLDWGDGASSSNCYGVHSYGAGNWNLTFTVTDNLGRKGIATRTISVTGTGGTTTPPPTTGGGPTATLTGGPFSGAAPLAVYLDGTGSKPAGDGSWISQCRLDWGDGTSTSGCYGQHSYGAGTWTATFTVTDNKGRTGSAVRTVMASGGSGAQGVYQPGYHAALRWSYAVPSLTTFRMRIPMMRAGSKIRVSLDAGDSGATLHRATVALASGATGNTSGAPIPLSFGGRSGLTLAARARAISDPVSLDVTRGTELYVSFEVTGSMAASAINLLPGSYLRAGSFSGVSSGFGGTSRQLPTGVTNIDVLGAQERVYITLGDSITEGYTSGSDDYRHSWPFIAASRSGRSVVPAAVSGSGILETLAHLQTEVLSVAGITDCTVLIGTNNLHSFTPAALEAKLSELYAKLKPKCRVWVMPITPRERTSVPGASIAEIQARRREVNGWIRGLSATYPVLDLDNVVRDPNNTDRFKSGYGEDGVHPTVLGNQKMGEAAATRF